MKRNTKKILSAVIVIVFFTIILPSVIFFKKTNPIIDANDNWSGESYSGFKDLDVVTANKFMISTSDKLASEVGSEILARGGNAVDAVIAAQMVLNVVQPQSSGIGGGAFLLYYDAKTKKTSYFNGRETAPAKSNSEMFLNENGQPKAFHDAVAGGLSVGTPGLLKMLKEAHDKYGKLPWKELFVPAIKIASEGFKMDEKIYLIAKDLEHLKDFEGVKKLYFKDDNTPKDVGTVIRNPALAKTLRDISKKGIGEFYEGEIAKDIVKKVRNSIKNQGYLSLEDLKNYQIKEGSLICGDYRNKYKICSMPLPSSGGITILQILGILENFDLSKFKPNSIESVHLISEATRLSYADRNQYLADSEDVPIKEMLDKEYLKLRSKLIISNKKLKKVKAGEFGRELSYIINQNVIETPSTTHLSIIDSEGNAIAMTSSIEYFFGSSLMVNGFMLNNQLTDFSFIPQIDGQLVANRLEPGKQPRSSMAPTFIFDENDDLIMIVGSPGGPRIIQFVVKAIIAYLDWNLDIQNAISLPNFIALRDVIELEKRTDLEQIKEPLMKMGHEVKIVDITSGIQAIAIGKDGIRGGADPRRNGLAIGK